MKHIKKFNKSIEKKMINENNVYNTLSKAVGEEFVNQFSDEFYRLRERYLMYRLRGDKHEASVQGTFYDIFDGNDDYDMEKLESNKQAILDYISLVVVFANPDDLLDASDAIRWSMGDRR